MTKEQKDYIVREYQAGRNEPMRIANELGIKTKNVYAFAFYHGITKKKRQWTDFEDAYIREHYKRKECRGLQGISSVLGCKVHDVEYRIRKLKKENKL